MTDAARNADVEEDTQSPIAEASAANNVVRVIQRSDFGCPCPIMEAPQCFPIDCDPPDCDNIDMGLLTDELFEKLNVQRQPVLGGVAEDIKEAVARELFLSPALHAPPLSRPIVQRPTRHPPVHQCTANGKRLQESDWDHCPHPQSFVRCGPHHRAKIHPLSKADVKELHRIWKNYRDDLTCPWYEQKPTFNDRDYNSFRRLSQVVVDSMVAEYKEPMILDQATISNTNEIGHPPHCDNVQFDSVWWKGKRIRKDDEVKAAQDGAYVLWRPENTSYRSYSCTVALTDPELYEGGEVQFFKRWGDKDPIESYKCEVGCGVAFCGCQRNIHAVTGVKSGFRLVLLVWTRPPHVRVPENQVHVCYFRPGTGRGVWLTTADQQRRKSLKKDRTSEKAWSPKEDEDSSCTCPKCEAERRKLAWKDCLPLTPKEAALELSAVLSTPPTSAGTSPRTPTQTDGQVSDAEGSSADGSNQTPMSPRTPPLHCPRPQARVQCGPHHRVELKNVISDADMWQLYRIWEKHQDDLTWPWYEKKPDFAENEFYTFRAIAQKVVDVMVEAYRTPLVLDQATVSNTNHLGHPPHADNVQFDSVWWRGKQIKQKDELVAARGGAEVLWKEAKTSYRSYSASIALTDPWQYGGGDLEFYSEWGQKEPSITYRCDSGSGVAFCGCHKNIHAVTGVKWGFRLMLLIWVRPPDVRVPDDQRHVCYYRPGTGSSIWLTTADLQQFPSRRQKRQSWVPVMNGSEKDEETGETTAPPKTS